MKKIAKRVITFPKKENVLKEKQTSFLLNNIVFLVSLKDIGRTFYKNDINRGWIVGGESGAEVFIFASVYFCLFCCLSFFQNLLLFFFLFFYFLPFQGMRCLCILQTFCCQFSKQLFNRKTSLTINILALHTQPASQRHLKEP